MICPYCQTNIKNVKDAKICPACSAPHHPECWEENHGCTTYGCAENPTSRQTGVDVGDLTPAEVKNLIEKEKKVITCPNCKLEIEANASFCKHCGYSFTAVPKEEAKQQFEKEFKTRYRQKLSSSRKRWLTTGASAFILLFLVVFASVIALKKINNYVGSDEYKIKEFVIEWRKAWENKDIMKYRELLDKDYIYYDKDNKPVAYADKITRMTMTFEKYKVIKLKISDMTIQMDSASKDYANVKFRQVYVSDKITEEGMKTLRLYRGAENNFRWKIYREYFE